MFFEITKHFISPHSEAVKAQGHLSIRQIGGEAPRIFLTDTPMDQQIGRIDLQSSQITSPQPDRLTELVDVTTERSPFKMVIDPNLGISLLAQYLEPMLSIQPAQTTGHAQQLRRTRHLSGNSAQTHRPALKDPNHQPDEVAYLCNALSRSQFPNPLKPSMIECVDRHGSPPVRKFSGKNHYIWFDPVDQLFFC
jgi:hypothetical protein